MKPLDPGDPLQQMGNVWIYGIDALDLINYDGELS